MAGLNLSLQMGTLYASGDSSTFTGTGGPWGFSPFTSQFGGVVSSAGLAAEPFSDTVYNVAAGDEVIFVLALQNLSQGQGAFDVALRAALPAGFALPAAGTNLSVTDGAGNPIAFSGDLFGAGLQLAAPVGAYAADSGANVVLATYSLVAASGLPGPNATIGASAGLVRAAATPGGPDQSAGLSAGTSLVSAAPVPAVQAETSAAAVAKGQTIAFDVSIPVPAGVMRDVRLDTVLPAGASQLKLRSAAITAIGPALTVGGTAAGPDGGIALGTVTSTGDPAGNTLTARIVLEADGVSSGAAVLQTVLSAAATDGSRWSAQVNSSVGVVVPPIPPGIAGLWSGQGINAGGALHPLGGLVLSGNAGGNATLAVTLQDASLGRLSGGGGTGAFNAAGSTFVAFGSLAALQAAARQLVFTGSAAGTERLTVSLLDANGGLAQDDSTGVTVSAGSGDAVTVASGGSLWAPTLPSTLMLRGQNATVTADAVLATPTVLGFGAGDRLILPGTAPTLGFVPGSNILTVGGTALHLIGTYDAAWFTVQTAGPGTLVLGFRPDPLFNAAFYLARNPDVAAAGLDPFQHFLSNGWREGRAPTPLFDPLYYLARNPDVAAAGVNPLLHYESSGWREGRDPSAQFSGRDYLAANPDVARAGMNPLLHYVSSGQGEGRSSFAVSALPQNPMIDLGDYYSRYADVRNAGANGNDHYLTNGWREGRLPNPVFDTRFYLAQAPDVQAAGLDPLMHYENSGHGEGRAVSLVFDGAKYLAANPDVRAAGLDPVAHYLNSGRFEGRAAPLWGGTLAQDPLVSPAFLDPSIGATLVPTGPGAMEQAAWLYDTMGWRRGVDPSQWFSTSYYLSHNPDVAAAGVNPLLHYETNGWREGRDPSAAFSTKQYLAANLDVARAGLDPLMHYVVNGIAEGRQAWSV